MIETPLITATNLALAKTPDDDGFGHDSIVLVLNHSFPVLSDLSRSQIKYDLLLPTLIQSMFHSNEGLRSAYFLGAVDLDVQPATESTFQWPERSQSFLQVQRIMSAPLVSSLGPLSRLIGHAIEQVRHPRIVTTALDDIEDFAATLNRQWRQNKLSEIDPSEESVFLDPETLGQTIPRLWKLLQSILFATVIILRSVVGRSLGDRVLASGQGEMLVDEICSAHCILMAKAAAPTLAIKSLRILRSLYFITSRRGSSPFSQYTFVYLTTIDILAAYSSQCENFLRSIQPVDHAVIPTHPLNRCLDLFFLNTAEHFTSAVPFKTNEDLLVAAASPYLATGENGNLMPMFEAAHSLMLSVFSAQQNSDLTARHLPFYVNTVFQSFPRNLTARQFRLAFHTLLRLTSPPAPLSVAQPMLAATLLELLREQAAHASVAPLFSPDAIGARPGCEPSLALSEQAVLVLAGIDCLSQVSLEMLDEWLPLTAEMVNSITDPGMREYGRENFWRVLVNGEMDLERGQVCHEWWTTRGGREAVLGDGVDLAAQEVPVMSGAICDDLKESKL